MQPSAPNAFAAFAVTSEQRELRAAVRGFLRAASPEAEVRRLMTDPLGRDPVVWRRLATELELAGIIVPTAYGGAGAGFVELAIVAEEMGRALFCGPFLATAALAAPALLAAGDPSACAQYLPAWCRGEQVATLALCSSRERWLPRTDLIHADSRGGVPRLTGEASPVVDGASSDVLLVAADSDGGATLYAVDAAAPGVVRTPLRVLDPTRKLARVRLTDVVGQPIGPAGEAATVLSRVADLAAVALAAEQAGAAQRALELVVEYAKMRNQFGAPIGTFQAVKHQCAELLVQVESAITAARYAAWTAASVPAELPAAASIARAYCSEAFVTTAEVALHLHGGIGFTWEHPAQLYWKRAKSSELLFGTPRQHRADLADRLDFSALR